ncbi:MULTISPECIES: hypothetical protein [unclassified Microcoleus]|uniref:hypothetical protein n=1 Tax=unclassified Microcoleus TaxID=2642155 RepID=UPI0025E4D774|nr:MULTISPECIES: hypothetical protein [unclassified Microcoleus]
MIEPSSDGSEFSRGYQQALDDFGISQLLSCIRSYSDADFDAQRVLLQEKEVKSLAGHLIEQLTANLTGSLISSYLDILRKAGAKIIAEYSPNRQFTVQPEDNLQVTKTSDLFRQDYAKPWVIVRVLPDARNHIVARFCNRQDADDHLRALRRFVRSGIFEIAFDRAGDPELD